MTAVLAFHTPEVPGLVSALRDDRVAIGFAIAAPVGHEEGCHAERMLRSFTMKPPPEG